MNRFDDMEREVYPAPLPKRTKCKIYAKILDEDRWNGNALVLSRVDEFGTGSLWYRLQVLSVQRFRTLAEAQNAYLQALPKSRQAKYAEEHKLTPQQPSKGKQNRKP